jgi:methionyl-tRNA synthetase
MKKTFYITTAIDYVNGVPHLGTAYEKITADIINRFKKMAGYDTFFLMGNDEHSQNVHKKAQELGLDPLKYCDQMEEKFRAAWKSLNIEFDDFIRTTSERHKETVAGVLEAVYKNGDIYKGHYEGPYCVNCERFYTEKELNAEGNCPVHNRKPEHIKEENWFFRLSKYRDPLLKEIEKNPGLIRPEIRRNEIVNVLQSGLDDISISRAGSKWGVPIPWDAESVTYVWFDALINYLSGIGFSDNAGLYAKFWPADLHYIGKDITRFHCIYWPAMLLSAGIKIPRSIFGHGFIMQSGAKLSKSAGDRMDLAELTARLGADPLRYYLAREVALGQDGDFSIERFTEIYNAQLANDYGNLLSRTLSMIDKYHEGMVFRSAASDHRLENLSAQVVENYRTLFEDFKMKEAIMEAFRIISEGNLYIDEKKPWVLAKDPAVAEELKSVLYDLFESLRIVTILLKPVMPEKTALVWEQLNIASPLRDATLENAKWGTISDSHKINKGAPVFPRME